MNRYVPNKQLNEDDKRKRIEKIERDAHGKRECMQKRMRRREQNVYRKEENFLGMAGDYKFKHVEAIQSGQ